MVNFDYDCSGWATKANVRCYDGLVIAQDAFKECSGKVVPMVYNHDHANVDNVIGHCLLENRPGGVYCYAKFNDTDTGKTARQCVESGDLSAFSIFANGLKKVGSTVKHGFIREVSLVLAGCNPGALIDEVVKHSADEDYEGGEAFIYNEDGLSLTHGMDPEGNPLEDLTHSADSGDAVTDDKVTQEEAKMADEKNMNKEETVEDVFNTLTEKQKNVVYAIIGSVMPSEKDDDGEEDDTVKQNVFDKDTNATVLKHSIDEINNVVKTAKSHGTMKAAFEDAGMDSDELAHSIDNIDWLGSPPHGRGKGQLSVGHQIRERITSAWAGKSSWTKAISTRTLNHPRMGGEKLTPCGKANCGPGSPPRGRGKEFRVKTRFAHDGITPAWAGKSQVTAPGTFFRPDHPRVGGEKFTSCSAWDIVWGSPPRRRGKAAPAHSQERTEGITPA